MFAPRSGLSSNVGNRGGSTVQPLGPRNENSLIPRYNSTKPSLSNGNAPVTKTPAASGRRRALGDISNKKGGLSHPSNSSNNHKGKPSNGGDAPSMLKKPSFILQETSITPAPRKGLSIQPSNVKTTQKSTKKGLSASKIPAPSRTVDFQLPKSTSRAVLPETQSGVQTKEITSQKKVDIFPDVEILAGRSYEQQVANGEWDDDSPADLSIELPLSMWDDWKESLQLQMKEQEKRYAEEDARFEKELQDTMAKIFEEDGMYLPYIQKYLLFVMCT
jgi:hypothetical protein